MLFINDEATMVVETGENNIDRTSLFVIVIIVVIKVLMVEQCCNNIVIIAEQAC